MSILWRMDKFQRASGYFQDTQIEETSFPEFTNINEKLPDHEPDTPFFTVMSLHVAMLMRIICLHKSSTGVQVRS